MIEHFEHSDGLGAIYPSMQYAIMALDVLGYDANHPLRVQAEAEFKKLMVDDESRASTCSPASRPFGTHPSPPMP